MRPEHTSINATGSQYLAHRHVKGQSAVSVSSGTPPKIVTKSNIFFFSFPVSKSGNFYTAANKNL